MSFSYDKSPDKYIPYDFNLDEPYKAIAEKELGENDHKGQQALQQMREWIAKHPHIRACRTDPQFLLRFLRPKKFSVTQACDLLEQYLIYRQQYPKWYTQVDTEHVEVKALIDAGYSFPLMERDEFGRRVFLTAINRFDADKYNFAHMVRVHCLVVEASLGDEKSQVAGYHHVYDARGFGAKHLGMWSLTDINNFLRKAQHIAPMRHRAITLIFGTGHKVIEFALSLLSDKIRSRVRVAKDNTELAKYVDKKILPTEYGGTVPMKVMIEKFKDEMKEKRQELLSLDKLTIDTAHYNNKWGNSELENDNGIIGSFRQLQVD